MLCFPSVNVSLQELSIEAIFIHTLFKDEKIPHIMKLLCSFGASFILSSIHFITSIEIHLFSISD